MSFSHAKIRSIVNENSPLILIRGGGDLASGVALRLHRVGLKILITEQPQPLAVRRMVSFAEAVYQGKFSVEEVTARLVNGLNQVSAVLDCDEIPVFMDPGCEKVLSPCSSLAPPLALIDARMTKRPPDFGIDAALLVIGLGPGFVAGRNCHAAIETNRGHYLGRVIWDGSPEEDTGIPGVMARYQNDRVLRAPADGFIQTKVEIGERVQKGQLIAEVEGQKILAPIDGILRGLLRDGLAVQEGLKVGDIDPRNDPQFVTMVSEKSLAIGGGVLEALLTRSEIRDRLWN
ncbi:selenium-dependent molybdenum cofactor biosynthesis protein YqeB [Chloroflexota bacterium]